MGFSSGGGLIPHAPMGWNQMPGISAGTGGSPYSGAAGYGPDPAEDDRNRRNNLLSWLQGQYGANSRGPKLPPQPDIDTGPIWSQQQINQNVNAMRAKNDQRGAANQLQNNESLAARGYGSNSPLAAALNQMISGQTMATNTEGERGTRWDAATGNRQVKLDAETARSNAWAQAAAAMNQRHATQMAHRNALLAAMSGLA